MSTIVVTGATGIQGSAFVRQISNKYQNFNVVGLSRSPSKDSKLFQTDYSNHQIEVISRLFPDLIEVIHCAGVPSVFSSLKDPLIDHSNNLLPTLFSLELARRAGAQITFLSSAEVYGKSSDRSENGSAEPMNFYGLSKWCSERYVQLYHEIYQVPFQIIRASIIFANQLKRNVIFDLLSTFQQRRDTLYLFCTMDSTLDFIHADEVVSAWSFLRSKSLKNQIWNVSSGESVIFEDLFNWFCERYDYRPKVEIKEPNLQKKTLSHQKLRLAGWKPEVTFYQHLEQLVRS